MALLKAARSAFFPLCIGAHGRSKENNLIIAKAFPCIWHKRNSPDYTKLEISHSEDAHQPKAKLAPVGTNFTSIIFQDAFKNQ